jgi:hypothetical protein
MTRFARTAVALLAAGVANVAPAAAAESSDALVQVQKAVTQFCVPVTNGADAAETAQKAGIKPRSEWPPSAKAWAAGFTVGGTTIGQFFSLPLKTGTLLLLTDPPDTLQLGRQPGRLTTCRVELFDVPDEEGHRLYKAMEAYFDSQGYGRNPKVSGRDGLTVEFLRSGQTEDVLLSGPLKTTAKYNLKLEIMMLKSAR